MGVRVLCIRADASKKCMERPRPPRACRPGAIGAYTFRMRDSSGRTPLQCSFALCNHVERIGLEARGGGERARFRLDDNLSDVHGSLPRLNDCNDGSVRVAWRPTRTIPRFTRRRSCCGAGTGAIDCARRVCKRLAITRTACNHYRTHCGYRESGCNIYCSRYCTGRLRLYILRRTRKEYPHDM
jgi:hypothetical protein